MNWFEINKSFTIDPQRRLSFNRGSVIRIREPNEFLFG